MPTAKDALAGVTAILTSDAALTFSAAVPLTAPSEAVIVAAPGARPTAVPVEFTEATVDGAALHAAVVETFAVVPSLYVAVAVYC